MSGEQPTGPIMACHVWPSMLARYTDLQNIVFGRAGHTDQTTLHEAKGGKEPYQGGNAPRMASNATEKGTA